MGDTVRQIKNLRDIFDTTSEISTLLKYSPKGNSPGETVFHKLKDELVPETPDFRTFCPTRWTMRAASLQSVVENWVALQELWDDVLETKLDAETIGRVLGAKYQMETFEYFYCVSLGALVLKHSDNLSKTLQHTYISVSEGREIAELTVKTLQKMRSDGSFDMFWNTVTKRSKELKVIDPCLPSKRQRPARYLLGNAAAEFPADTLQDYYRHLYFQAIDTVITCIKERFNQVGYEIYYRKLEKLLLSAVNGEPYCPNLRFLCRYNEGDIDEFHLEAQPSLFATHLFREVNSHNSHFSIGDILKYFKGLTTAQKKLMSQVVLVVKLLLPAHYTNAVSERSCSALRRVKTYLRSTMGQSRLNHCMILNIHKDQVDKMNLIDIANKFCWNNESRQTYFGKFSEHDVVSLHKETRTVSTQT